MLSALKASIIHAFFQHWKWNAFSLILQYFLRVFFTNSEIATKSKFSLETLNILSALKFTGSHLALYDWQVSFSLISPIIFSLGYTCFADEYLAVPSEVSFFFIHPLPRKTDESCDYIRLIRLPQKWPSQCCYTAAVRRVWSIHWISMYQKADPKISIHKMV